MPGRRIFRRRKQLPQQKREQHRNEESRAMIPTDVRNQQQQHQAHRYTGQHYYPKHLQQPDLPHG